MYVITLSWKSSNQDFQSTFKLFIDRKTNSTIKIYQNYFVLRVLLTIQENISVLGYYVKGYMSALQQSTLLGRHTITFTKGIAGATPSTSMFMAIQRA